MAKTKKESRPAVKKADPAKREERIKQALKSVRANFGEESIRILSSEQKSDVDVISLGAPGLDAALGVGGLPRGRIVEIYGPEASGKTTVALHAVASAQKEGGVAVLIDAEHAFDPQYAARLGIDLDSLLVSQPESSEQALEICDELVRSGAVDIVVIDSVAALVPKAELEGQMGDTHVGLQARLMSQALRKLTGNVSKTDTCLIFINQLREKVGVMFGSPETTPGGRALKYYASVRLDLRRIGSIKSGDQVIGSMCRMKVVKNKVAPPFRLCEFEITFGKGINYTGNLVDLATEHKIIQKSGAWYKYNGTSLGQGREATIAFFDAEENKDLRDEVEDLLMLQLFPERLAQKEEEEAAGNEEAEKEQKVEKAGKQS
jgi:recombination protein RecA